MPFFDSVANIAARKMPRVINPTTHAVLDYAVAGGFFFMAARFWRTNRRAALGALFCGGATVTNSVLTNYPGGALKLVDYKTHGKIDAGLAAITASAPQFLGFSDKSEARFFSIQAIAETMITGLTDFNHYATIPEEHPLQAAS